MPYISQSNRDAYEPALSTMRTRAAYATVGELTYMVTSLVLAWLQTHPNYTEYNAAIGVLECAKLELYRRQVAPYEDQKREQNGDVQ